MDVSQLELPSLEELLEGEKKIWEKANKIGKTATSWEQHESYIRSEYARLMGMNEEERDVALVEGHLAKAGMIESTLRHIDTVLMPAARAKEAAEAASRNRADRRRRAKKGQGQRGKRRKR